MANIRVYELARELNMENKALLEKVKELDIAVKSHMSTLDESDVNRIKEDLFGPKEPAEIVEDKRIKPNVIRRRRKRVTTAPAEPDVAETGDVAAEKEADKKTGKKAAPPKKEIKKKKEPEENISWAQYKSKSKQ